jgi:hypothetical protein
MVAACLRRHCRSCLPPRRNGDSGPFHDPKINGQYPTDAAHATLRSFSHVGPALCMNCRTKLIISRTLLALSVGLYIASLYEYAYFCRPDDEGHHDCDMTGFHALVSGGFAAVFYVFNPPSVLAWWANPVLLAAWLTIFSRARGPAIILTMIALLLASSFLFMKTVPGGGAEDQEIVGVGLGYWLWLASLGAAFVAALHATRIARLLPK